MPAKRKSKSSHSAYRQKNSLHNKRNSDSSRDNCLAIIRLDSQSIRKKYIANFKRARTTYRKAREELDFFENEENPAFERWMFRECGQEISEIREVQRELQNKNRLLHRIQVASSLTGLDPAEAYRRILNGENPDERRDMYNEAYDDADEDWDEEDTEGAEFEDEFDDFFNAFNDFLNTLCGLEEDEDGEKDEEEQNRRRRVKDIYRDICRRLHPDAEGSNTDEELHIWYEVQEAYEDEDLDRLETLRAKTDIARGGVGKNMPVSDIQRLTDELRSARNSVRSLIRRARQAEGWGFFKRSQEELEEQAEIIRHDFRREKNFIKDDLDFVERRLEILQKQAQEMEKRQKKNTRQHASFSQQNQPSASARSKEQQAKAEPHPDQLEFDFS